LSTSSEKVNIDVVMPKADEDEHKFKIWPDKPTEGPECQPAPDRRNDLARPSFAGVRPIIRPRLKTGKHGLPVENVAQCWGALCAAAGRTHPPYPAPARFSFVWIDAEVLFSNRGLRMDLEVLNPRMNNPLPIF